MKAIPVLFAFASLSWVSVAADDFPAPYLPPCVEREKVFAFTEKPVVKTVGPDKYEITFTVKGNCDVTVGIVDTEGRVVRHIGSGVLGANAPAPFQKNSLKQTVYWNGKDDLEVYPREPEKLKVRVMLGLKPFFDKRLGGKSPHNLPGTVFGLAIGPDAAYTLSHSGGFGHGTIRKFDREGGYLCTVSPPPSLPENKQEGMGYVEYEPGRRGRHGPNMDFGAASYVPGFTFDAVFIKSCQPVVVGNRLIFANAGYMRQSPGSFLHYVFADGSTDAAGVKGLPFVKERVLTRDFRLAVSPDEKKVYLSSTGTEDGKPSTGVWVRRLDGDKPAELFAGAFGKPGSGQGHFGNAQGIDCDAEGRVYVADSVNNRIQVFSPDGLFLKTIPLDRPDLICVHKKTGAIYVLHTARVEGRSLGRVTKLVSFADPREDFHWDNVMGFVALDSWSARPRLWLSGMRGRNAAHDGDPYLVYEGSGSVTIWEERDRKFEKIFDFEAEALKEAGAGWYGRWSGTGMLVMGSSNLSCDPTREKLYHQYQPSHVFDLGTGAYEGSFQSNSEALDDLAFDKLGYLHGHQNCRDSRGPCAWRVDPSAVSRKTEKGKTSLSYPERLYDYGEEKAGWKGCLPTRCQAGAKGFQDGFGVNMRGDVVVESNISYVPKMQDEGESFAMAGSVALSAAGLYNEEGNRYNAMLRKIQEAQKLGEEVYSIKRQAGIPLTGATLWVYERSGELRSGSPAVVGGLVAGAQIDEDGLVYTLMDRTRLVGGKEFLAGRGGHFGSDKKETPFMGTLVKAKVETLKVLLKNAIIPLDAFPNRPPDVSHPEGWVEGAEWLYAGASPIVSGGCSCPSSRFHLDWYKRVYVPEIYRNSIGILDSNGNLVMHLGRYANFDGAPGGKEGAAPGGEDIGMTSVRYLSGTDNYLTFQDRGDRIVVLKLAYQAEEQVPIRAK